MRWSATSVLFLLCFVAGSFAHPEVINVTPENVEDVLSKLKFPEMHEKRSKPFTFFVEGIVGSGKSTLLSFFQNYQHMDILPEPVDKWTNLNGTDVLKLVFEDPGRWGGTQESMVLLTMVEEHLRKFGLVKGMERSVHSARFVFGEVFRKSYTHMEYGILDGWYRLLAKNIDVSADLIIYLRTDPNVAFGRVKKRARPEEKNLKLEFLNDLHRLHEDWLVHGNSTIPGIVVPGPRVMVIDTNHPMPDMMRLYMLLVEKIRNSLPTSEKLWCHFSRA